MEPTKNAPEPFEHAGLTVYPYTNKAGDLRWAVQQPENKGTRSVLGDTIHTTVDEARKAAESEARYLASRAEARAAAAAEEQARADAKKARSAETAGKSLAEIKAMDHMNRTIRVDGKDMKAHEFVDARLAAGDVPKVEMVDRVAPMSRRAFNNASNAEQRAHEAKVKAAGKKE